MRVSCLVVIIDKHAYSRQDRTVVVREVDGTLRTATPEEHDRMNRVYYEKAHRPVDPPAVFSDPWLKVSIYPRLHKHGVSIKTRWF